MELILEILFFFALDQVNPDTVFDLSFQIDHPAMKWEAKWWMSKPERLDAFVYGMEELRISCDLRQPHLLGHWGLEECIKRDVDYLRRVFKENQKKRKR